MTRGHTAPVVKDMDKNQCNTRIFKLKYAESHEGDRKLESHNTEPWGV